MIACVGDVSMGVGIMYLGGFDALPDDTDKLVVVGSDGLLKGVLPI